MTKERKKRSVIYGPTTEEFQKIVKAYDSLAKILEYFGVGTGNYKTLKTRLASENIDYSHIKMGLDSNKYRTRPAKKHISEYLKENIKVSCQQLKRRLIKESIFEDKCVVCGQGSEWNGKDLVLQLDHINGDHDDNRLDNLRIICPNCHTQTPTFSGRKGKVNNHRCEKCNRKISPNASKCQRCHLLPLSHNQETKISWPETHELIKLTSEFGFREIGRRLGVSDNAIRKHINKTD